jgi:ABC-2 type transport system permease protein
MSNSININMIKKLILKEWFISRSYIALYTFGCLFALSFISLGQWQFFMGTTLLICILVGMSNHQVSISIINERKEQTLPFIMSLPITPTDYAVAKLIANTTLFLIPWLIILFSTIAIFYFTSIPDGLIPFSTILCTYILLSYFISWAVGMSIESEGIIIFVMVFLNCWIGPIFYILGNTPSMSQYYFQPDAVWNSTSVGILLAEIFLIILVLATAFFLQTRKKTFL